MARRELKKRKANRRAIMIGLLVVALLSGLASYQGLQLKQRNETYQQELDYWQQQIDEQKQRQDDLANYKSYTKTKEFYEWYAREKMGLIYDNEILFIPE